MFYNGFTLLMQILAGATMYHVGRHFGYSQGEADQVNRQRRVAEAIQRVNKRIGI